jgi:hypothetical protein
MVAEDTEKETDEVPDTDKDTVIAPVAGFGNELSVQHRRAKGQDSDDDQTDVLAAVLDRYNFSCSSECNKFVETSTDSREDIASYICQWDLMTLCA